MALRRRDGPSCRWPCLLLLYAAGSLAWSPDPMVGLGLWWQFALLFTVAWLAPDDMRPVYFAIGCGLAINSVVVAFQIEGFQPINHVAGQVASGLFFNKNYQNLFVALGVIGLLSTRQFLLAVIAALPLPILPLSRDPIVALAAAGAGALRGWWRVAAIAGGAVLLVALVGYSGRVLANVQRLQTWADAASHLSVFGHGLGSFRWAYPEMEYAHNDALQIAYELGIPGLVAGVSGSAYILWSGPSAERMIVLAFLVEGLFDFPLYQPATGFLAALAAGHVVRARCGLCGDRYRRKRVDHAGKAPARSA